MGLCSRLLLRCDDFAPVVLCCVAASYVRRMVVACAYSQKSPHRRAITILRSDIFLAILACYIGQCDTHRFCRHRRHRELNRAPSAASLYFLRRRLRFLLSLFSSAFLAQCTSRRRLTTSLPYCLALFFRRLISRAFSMCSLSPSPRRVVSLCWRFLSPSLHPRLLFLLYVRLSFCFCFCKCDCVVDRLSCC